MIKKSCETCEKTMYTRTCGILCTSEHEAWMPRPSLIKGVASEEKVTNELGGKQSKLEYRFDLIDTKAIFALANVLHTGEQEYGKDNWRKIDAESHLNHAIAHIYAYMAGDKQDDHLSHAFCRLMMAMGVEPNE